MRDKQDIAREEYKQLLMETKLITHKSLQMIKDKEGNHMEEIEEVLCKDSRYHGTFVSLDIVVGCGWLFCWSGSGLSLPW